MMTNIRIERSGEFRTGWQVVAAANIGLGLGLPTLAFYTVGLIAPQLSRSFGWTLASIHAGLFILTTTLAIAAPVAGYLADRFGTRPVAIASQILVGLAFMSFYFVSGSLWQFYLSWVLLALVGAGTTPATLTRPVVAHFDRRRGLAIGLALLGPGLFAALIKPVGAFLIGEFGWRSAYLAIGLLPITIAVLASFFGFRDRRAPETLSQSRRDDPVPDGITLSEAMHEWRFWLLAAVFLPVSIGLTGPLPHIENLLAENGFAARDVILLASTIGVALMTGRLLGGWLMDRMWAPAVGAAVLLLAACGSWLLSAGSAQFAPVLLALLLLGLAGGIEYDLLGYLVTRYFGRRHYSTIYGALFGVFLLGGGGAPLLFGHAFDRFGSYDGILRLTALGLMIAAGLLLTLGRYRYRAGTGSG